MSEKPLVNYKYKPRIHEVDPDNNQITFVLEEVDGNDGFAVTMPLDLFKQMMTSKNGKAKLKELLKVEVKRRLEELARSKELEARKKNAEEEIKDLKEIVEKVEIFASEAIG